MEADIKKLGGLATVLLSLMIIVGVVFLVGAKWKANICTAESSTYVYADNACYNGSLSVNTTGTVTITALTQVGIIETAIVTMLSFLGILVLVGIAKILIKMTKSF